VDEVCEPREKLLGSSVLVVDVEAGARCVLFPGEHQDEQQNIT
jgi:hypothetical protein